MTLLAVDPGLAACGLAVWRRPAERLATLNGYAPLFVTAWTLRTASATPMGQRLDYLWMAATAAVREHHVTAALIERPARRGVYARNARTSQAAIAEGMSLHDMATGVLWLACHQAGVREIRWIAADKRTDAGRAEQLRLVLGDRLAKESEHARVAAWHGLRALLDHRRTWEAA